MGAGVIPGRSVDEHAKALGDGKSYGLLWLPPASLQSGHLTCVGFSWADGSSKLNPDPELLGLLEAA